MFPLLVHGKNISKHISKYSSPDLSLKRMFILGLICFAIWHNIILSLTGESPTGFSEPAGIGLPGSTRKNNAAETVRIDLYIPEAIF